MRGECTVAAADRGADAANHNGVILRARRRPVAAMPGVANRGRAGRPRRRAGPAVRRSDPSFCGNLPRSRPRPAPRGRVVTGTDPLRCGRTIDRVAPSRTVRCRWRFGNDPQDWQRFAARFRQIETNVERVVRGKHAGDPARARRAGRRGAPADRGRARRRQDDARQGDRSLDRLLVPPDPVHARPAADRRHRRQRLQPGAAATSSSSPGAIFANIVLADEINRASPKTQSALLECMEERQVTVDAETHPLGTPFMVIATQNPIEHEGTYPLPEAQLDRFMLRLVDRLPEPRGRGRDPREPHAPAPPSTTSGPSATRRASPR